RDPGALPGRGPGRRRRHGRGARLLPGRRARGPRTVEHRRSAPVALRGRVEPPGPALRELRRGERVRRAVLRARSGTHAPGGPHARLGPMRMPGSSRATSRDPSGGRAGTVRLPRAAAVALALAVLLAGAATPLRA